MLSSTPIPTQNDTRVTTGSTELPRSRASSSHFLLSAASPFTSRQLLLQPEAPSPEPLTKTATRELDGDSVTSRKLKYVEASPAWACGRSMPSVLDRRNPGQPPPKPPVFVGSVTFQSPCWARQTSSRHSLTWRPRRRAGPSEIPRDGPEPSCQPGQEGAGDDVLEMRNAKTERYSEAFATPQL